MLGDGTTGTQMIFTEIETNVISLAAGYNYTMLIKGDGTLWAVGAGGEGRLGSGNTTTVNKGFIKIEIGTDNAKVFAGKWNHTMLIKNSGALLAAGGNGSGQLGIGTTTNNSKFTEVVDAEGIVISGVALVSLGESHSMILKNDGTLFATGNNSDLRLGLKGATNRKKAEKALDSVVGVAAGFNHTLAVTEDGRLWAAGSNTNGQFGGSLTGEAIGEWKEVNIVGLN
jgi:alpha-tubulin suppressor-like RCC1 family protein